MARPARLPDRNDEVAAWVRAPGPLAGLAAVDLSRPMAAVRAHVLPSNALASPKAAMKDRTAALEALILGS